MKITVIPALCLLPLIEASRSTIKTGAIKMKWHPARFLARNVAKVWAAITSRVPFGYEDGMGLHRGEAEVLPLVIRTSRIRNRPAGKPCSQARWKATRTTNLISGRQLVLQRDSSSLPPFRLSPESFSTKPSPRHLAETGKCLSSFTGTSRTGKSCILDFNAGHWSRPVTSTSTRR